MPKKKRKTNKKKRKKRKNSEPKTKNWNKLYSFTKKCIPYLLMVGLMVVLFLGGRFLFFSIPYFKIKGINIVSQGREYRKEDDLRKYPMLVRYEGKSIFMVRLKQLSDALKKDFPELKQISVNRLMPDILEINIVPRVPVAVIKSFGYYPVDEEGFILSADMQLADVLPFITGIPIWVRPKVGERLGSTRLKMALITIDQLKRTDIIRKYGVKRLEVANKRNQLLFLKEGLEVRLGHGEFPDKFKRLEKILDDGKIDKQNLRYIDLRFEDAVLGPR